MISRLWKKMFYSPYFYTIALRKRSTKDILSAPQFSADYVFPATYRKWVADPILVDYEDKTYLFYEAVENDKGRIEVVQVNEDCTVSPAKVILEDNCHYSYPFVFLYNQEWYMIPESSASNEVRLYKARAFPYDWHLERILLHQKSVDTTVFAKAGKLYLLTFLLYEDTERVIPQAYLLDMHKEDPILTPLSWESYDRLKSRGAGPVFEKNGALIRPAQRSEAQQYGNGLLFYRIQNVDETYAEDLIGRLDPEYVKANGVWIDGLHTYTLSKKYEAIDIRCREFEAGKIFRVLRNKLR